MGTWIVKFLQEKRSNSDWSTTRLVHELSPLEIIPFKKVTCRLGLGANHSKWFVLKMRVQSKRDGVFLVWKILNIDEAVAFRKYRIISVNQGRPYKTLKTWLLRQCIQEFQKMERSVMLQVPRELQSVSGLDVSCFYSNLTTFCFT